MAFIPLTDEHNGARISVESEAISAVREENGGHAKTAVWVGSAIACFYVREDFDTVTQMIAEATAPPPPPWHVVEEAASDEHREWEYHAGEPF